MITEEQKKILKENYPILRRDKVANLLGKSERWVKRWTERLGIKKSIEFWRQGWNVENKKTKEFSELVTNGMLKSSNSGNIWWTKGVKSSHSKEARAKAANSLKEHLKLHPRIIKQSTRDKLSSFWKEKWKNVEYRENMLKILKSEENRQRFKNYKFTDEQLKKIGDHTRKWFASLNDEQREKHFKRLLSKSEEKPNIIEKRISDIFKSNNLPYKYVGDFSFWLGGKNPDFLNINGKKEVIEVNGCYYHGCKECYPEGGHKEIIDDSKERIEHFKKYGFDCKIIWEHDIRKKSDEHVLKTLGIK